MKEISTSRKLLFHRVNNFFCSALILPVDVPPDTDIETHDYWVGQIVEIRATQEHDNNKEDYIPRNVWARVRWFWSGTDVAEIRESL